MQATNPTNIPCSVCKGKATITLRIVDHIAGKAPETKPPVQLPCIHCNGTGYMTPEQVAQHEWEQAQWCRCSDIHDSTYYDDGEHPDCHKHHWRCDACGLITQIG